MSCKTSCGGCTGCTGKCASSSCTSACYSKCDGGCVSGCTKCTGCTGCNGCSSNCENCSGCGSSCSTGCSGGCEGCGGCDTTCTGGCGGSCQDTCTGCDNGCTKTANVNNFNTYIRNFNFNAGVMLKRDQAAFIVKQAIVEWARRNNTTAIPNYGPNKSLDTATTNSIANSLSTVLNSIMPTMVKKEWQYELEGLLVQLGLARATANTIVASIMVNRATMNGDPKTKMVALFDQKVNTGWSNTYF